MFFGLSALTSRVAAHRLAGARLGQAAISAALVGAYLALDFFPGMYMLQASAACVWRAGGRGGGAGGRAGGACCYACACGHASVGPGRVGRCSCAGCCCAGWLPGCNGERGACHPARAIDWKGRKCRKLAQLTRCALVARVGAKGHLQGT